MPLTNAAEGNLFLTSAPLSDSELYYVPGIPPGASNAQLNGDEAYHAAHVMRCRAGERLLLTNGTGCIFQAEVLSAASSLVTLRLLNVTEYPNPLAKIVFCVPRLKNPDRMAFALEKCVELGITRFILLSSERTIPRTDKTERYTKILISAMKQSLRAWLPAIQGNALLNKGFLQNKNVVLLSQAANTPFGANNLPSGEDVYLIFGPEGGTTPAEDALFPTSSQFSLGPARLRAETAVVMAAALVAYPVL